MPFPSSPPNWGADEITKFFDAARSNQYATFVQRPTEVARLNDVDRVYRSAIHSFNDSKDWFAGLFLLRGHSNFLAACRLCLSTQVPETYALLRSCLENAMYGVYLAKHPHLSELWLRRHDGASAKQKVRNEFKVRSMLNFAKELDAKEGERAEFLYEQTIDYGAHPNELAVMQTLQIKKTVDQTELQSTYLGGDTVALTAVLKATKEVGICSLSLFQMIDPDGFHTKGVSALLSKLKDNF